MARLRLITSNVLFLVHMYSESIVCFDLPFLVHQVPGIPSRQSRLVPEITASRSENDSIWFHTAVVKIFRSLCQVLLKVFFASTRGCRAQQFEFCQGEEVARSFYRKTKLFKCWYCGGSGKTEKSSTYIMYCKWSLLFKQMAPY